MDFLNFLRTLLNGVLFRFVPQIIIIHTGSYKQRNGTEQTFEPPQQYAYAKTKVQISFAVASKLISAFVFAKRIVQSLFYLYPKFQASIQPELLSYFNIST